MKNYLVISALGKDRPGIVHDLSTLIYEHGCNVVDSRMTVLGGEFAIILMISGNWNEVAKIEDFLPEIARQLDLTIISRRTEPRDNRSNLMPYSVEVISIDHPGIVNNISDFFSSREINIEELNTGSYSAAHTGTTMFTVNLVVSVPSKVLIGELREQFMDFCDSLNLDAVIEPIKG
ncbi:MAG: glycine cleavage system protein R [Gammaproteobacteria bacterium]|nr:MAG: glycine cleavage system protein R [Gammaproteobacteria bacterium]